MITMVSALVFLGLLSVSALVAAGFSLLIAAARGLRIGREEGSSMEA